MTKPHTLAIGLLAVLLGSNAAAGPEGYALLWESTFDADRPDPTTWKVSNDGRWRAENVRVAEGSLRLRAAVDDGKRLGGEARTGKSHGGPFSLRTVTPPIRIDIRFKPVMRPGSFIALWLMHTAWDPERFAEEGMAVGKEFDLLECSGGQNVVTDDDIRMKAHMTVHAWRAPWPWVPGGHKSRFVKAAPTISLGRPVAWQEVRVDWDDASRPAGRELRYYWRAAGRPWGEPRLVVRPERDFYPPKHRMNQAAFGDVRHVDILKATWNDPMHLILWNQARRPSGWLSQEQLAKRGENTWGGKAPDPKDFPVDVPIDFVRVYVPAGDPRLEPQEKDDG